MRGINKAIILGNLGADPQAVTFQDGNTIVNLSIATSESWTDRSGNPQENTQWHKVRLSGKLAEIGLRMLAKGSQVYVEGSIKTRKWTDKNNQPQYITEIYAEKMEIITFTKQQDNIQNSIKDSIPFGTNETIATHSMKPNLTNPQPTNIMVNNNENGWIPF